MSLKPPAPDYDDSDYDFELTIRFSASLPNLLLSILVTLYANTATHKQLIRSHAPRRLLEPSYPTDLLGKGPRRRCPTAPRAQVQR